jgi:hypothetical protein
VRRDCLQSAGKETTLQWAISCSNLALPLELPIDCR